MRGINVAGDPGTDNLDVDQDLGLEDATDEANDDLGEDIGDDAGEDAGDADDPAEDAEPKKEAEPRGNVTETERKLQLANDRLGNEVGSLRKAMDLMVGLLERAGVGLPTPDDWAKDPDKAAKIDQDYKKSKQEIEESRIRSEARDVVLSRNPDFDSLVPGMVALLKEDGVEDSVIRQFKSDPFSTFQGSVLHNLARAARYQRRVSAEAPRKAQPQEKAAEQRRSFPTNDRSGHAPATVSRGPMTAERLEALMKKNPAAVEKALESATTEEINALAKVLQERKQRRR